MGLWNSSRWTAALSLTGLLGACGGPASPNQPGPDNSNAKDTLCGVRPGGTSGHGTETLRFEREDPPLTVIIQRKFDAQGVGHSSIFSLQKFGLRMDGQALCNAGSFDYENSHHNWADRARATIDGVAYELSFDYGVTGGGWSISLSGKDAGGQTVLQAEALTPTGGPLLCWGCPSFVPVIVSEFSVQTDAQDAASEADPWIELFNPSSQPVSLAGWHLSDDLLDRKKWQFPDVTIGRHETMLLWADAQEEQGELHTNFRLGTEGALVMTMPDGVTNGGFLFSGLEVSQSTGFDYNEGGYVKQDTPTPGERNPGLE